MEVTEVTCKAGLHKQQNGRHWQNSVKTTLGNGLHCFKRVILDYRNIGLEIQSVRLTEGASEGWVPIIQ